MKIYDETLTIQASQENSTTYPHQVHVSSSSATITCPCDKVHHFFHNSKAVALDNIFTGQVEKHILPVLKSVFFSMQEGGELQVIVGQGATPPEAMHTLPGHNEVNLHRLIQSAGFSIVDDETRGEYKSIHSFKCMDAGERQIAPNINEIREDHQGRYFFAADTLQNPLRILDAACGVGYGTHILAHHFPNASLTGLDLSKHAIDYANAFYKTDNVSFIHQDIFSYSTDTLFDAIVSFETVEHVEDVKQLLRLFHSLLVPGGTFICSTPNQNTLPYTPESFPFHIQHFTSEEMTALLSDVGFTCNSIHSQHSRESLTISHDDTGLFLIFSSTAQGILNAYP